jgi:hypothetical protein
MNSFVNAVTQRLGSRHGANPAWDEDGLEPFSDFFADDLDDRPSLLKAWAMMFLTLAEVGLVALMLGRRR